jgi:hypothetical protein
MNVKHLYRDARCNDKDYVGLWFFVVQKKVRSFVIYAALHYFMLISMLTSFGVFRIT